MIEKLAAVGQPPALGGDAAVHQARRAFGSLLRRWHRNMEKHLPTLWAGNGMKSLTNGPKGARTLDLHNAIVALSQLSYGPAE